MANIPGTSQSQQMLDNGLIGRSRRAITSSADGGFGPLRIDRGNELFVQNLWNSIHALVEEGSVFVAQTATPGTGITISPATGTTFSDTQATVGIQNADTVPSLNNSGRDVIPLWVKLIITAAGTAGTDDHFASRLDSALRLSGGTQLVAKNVNPSYAAGDDCAQVFVLPTVAAATGNVRNVGRAEGRKAAAPAYVVGDVVTFLFGSVEQVQAQAITPTTAIGLVLPLPPVVIPPGWSWVLNEWMTARTAAQSAEVEIGYVVR